MKAPMQNGIYAQLTKARAWSVLILVVAITAGAVSVLPKLRISYELEDFFPKEDPELQRYEEHVALFGTDNEFLLVAVDKGASVFEREFMLHLNELTTDLAALPDVRGATSPTNYSEPVLAPLAQFDVPILIPGYGALSQDSIRIFKDGRLVGVLFSENAQAVTLVVECKERLSKRRSDELLARIEQTCAKHDLGQVYVSGRIHGQYHYIQKMQREFRRSMLFSLAALVVALTLLYRRLWAVLLPLLVVGLAVVWTLALVVIAGRTLSILTIVLPSILFVVGTSDVVHILERYVSELSVGKDKRSALAAGLREVSVATLLTSLTTSIGFAALLISSIGPIREFGAMTAIGVMLAYVLAFSVLPALLMLLPVPKQAVLKRSERWQRQLGKGFLFSLKRRKLIGLITLLLLVIGAFGLQQIKVNNYLLEDWPDDDPQKQEFFFFENNFSGVRPFELQVKLEEGQEPFDLELLRDLRQLETHLTDSFGVKATGSILTLLRGTHKALHGGSSKAYKLPNTEQDLLQAKRFLVGKAGEAWLDQYLSKNGRILRFNGKMLDEGGYVHKKKNAALMDFVTKHFDESPFTVHQTGMAYLIDRNNEQLSRELLLGLLVAFAVVSIIMAWAFRSVSMVLVSLVPNVLPLLLVGGAMGWLGIDLKVSTAVIFTIAFGIAVDDTIHFLAKFRAELGKGRTKIYALKRSYMAAGKAIAVTSIVLICGFGGLLFSELYGPFYLGLLVGMALVFALLADLFVLPMLLIAKRKK